MLDNMISTKKRYDQLVLPVTIICVVAILLVGVIRVITHASLFADGAYWLVYNIQTGQPILSGGRKFVEYLAQMPVHLSVKFDLISNTYILSILLGIGMLLFPAVNFALTIFLLRKESIKAMALLLAIVLCFMFSGSVGQSSLGISVATTCFALLVRSFSQPKWSGAALLFYSILLTNSYESTAILSALLIVVVIYRMRSKSNPISMKFAITLGIIYSYAFLNSWIWILFPYGGRSNRDSILNIENLLTYPNFDTLTILLFAALVVSLFRRPYLYLGCLILLLMITQLPSNTISLALLYQTRGFTTLLIAFGMAVYILLTYTAVQGLGLTGKVREWAVTSLLTISLLGVATNVATQISWLKFLYSFQQLVSMEDVPERLFEDLKVNDEIRLNSWAWTNPSLSLITRKTSDSSVILNPKWYQGWDPKVEEIGLEDKYRWVER